MAADCAERQHQPERWPQLKAAAEEDGVSAEEWVEDVLHRRFDSVGYLTAQAKANNGEAKPKPTKMNFNPETAVAGDTATNNVVETSAG